MVIRYASQTEPSASDGWSPRPSAPNPFVQPSLAGQLSGAITAGLARFRRRLLPMLLLAALPLAGAFVFQKVMPPLYQTAATVFVDPNGGRPGRADVPADPAILATQLNLATSRTVLQKAIEAEKLVQDSTLFARPTGLAALTRTALSLVRGSAAATVEDRPAAILRMMSENIAARRAQGANLIEIVATAPEPATAARLANAVAQTFVDDIILTVDKAQGSERARLLARAEDLRTRLREAEAKLAQFRSQNGLEPANGGAGGRAADQDLPSQLARARTAAIDARTRSDQIQKLLAAGKDIEAIADLVRSPSIERLRIQYNEAVAQEASFRTSLGPRHPAYLEAEQQAREKRRILLEGLRLAASGAKADMQAARDLEAALEKRLGVDAAAVAPSPPPAQMREIEREVELARLAYERQMRLVETADGADQPGIARLVARASVPLQPAEQQNAWIWKIAASAAGLLALLALLVGGRRARQPAGKKIRTGKTKPEKIRTRSFWTGKSGAGKGAQDEISTPAGHAPDLSPAMAAEVAMVRPAPGARERRVMPDASVPAAPVADTARDTIAHELAERGEEFALQTILVTASSPGLDKTAAAIDLARAAALLDVRVLLIEASEHDPALTGRFASGELSGVIALQGRDRVVVAAELAPGVRAWVIPAEGVRAVPANDVPLHRYTAIAGNFDLVIMDGPVMSGGLAERKLARTAQTIVVVVPESAQPGAGWVAGQLGVAVDSVRLIPVAFAPQPEVMMPPPERTAARPMSVVRLQKCA